MEGDSARLLDLINGFRVSQAIYVIATLGIPDLLCDRSLSCQEIAVLTRSHPRALYRLLRALAAVGLLDENACEGFSLTRIGKLLCSEMPGSRAAWARNTARPSIWQAWEHLLHTVRTGETAFRHVHGHDVWEFRARSTEDSAIFDLAMREGSLRVAVNLLSRYDFAQFGHIVDIGGGDGTLLATLLAHCTEIRGTLLDQPHVAAKAGEVLRRAGVNERCTIITGNFFDAVPAGADAYLLKFILHDWDDDQCTRILTKCRQAMVADAKLLIIERLIGPPNEGAESKLSDLNMMVNAGGQERSREEFSALLQGAGFTLRAVTALPGPLVLLEAM